MKTQSFRFLGLSGLAALTLLFLPASSSAAMGGVGQGGHGKSGVGTGDDDVGTLPDSVLPDSPSIVFVGTLGEFQWVIQSLKGEGKVSLRPVAPGSERLLLELDGNFELTLDLEALSASHVDTYFSSGTTFAGGAAAVSIDGAWSRTAQLGAYSTRALHLDAGYATLVMAVSPEGQTYGLRALPQGSLMHVSQALR